MGNVFLEPKKEGGSDEEEANAPRKGHQTKVCLRIIYEKIDSKFCHNQEFSNMKVNRLSEPFIEIIERWEIEGEPETKGQEVHMGLTDPQYFLLFNYLNERRVKL